MSYRELPVHLLHELPLRVLEHRCQLAADEPVVVRHLTQHRNPFGWIRDGLVLAVELDLEKHESVERPEKPVELPRPQPVAHLLDDTVLGGLEKRLGHIVRNHRLDFASSYAGAALTGQHRPPPLAGTD